MRQLQKPPSFVFSPEKTDVVSRAWQDPAVRSYIAEANDEYFHWEKLRHRPLPQRRDDAVERHFMRIAEREVADAGFGTTLSVTRQKIKLMNPLVAVRGCFDAI